MAERQRSTENFVALIEKQGNLPLKTLLDILQNKGPTALLEKRKRKLMDYNLRRDVAMDEENATFETNPGLKARFTYQALHQQLLQDLPALTHYSLSIIQLVIACYLYARRIYFFSRMQADETALEISLTGISKNDAKFAVSKLSETCSKLPRIEGRSKKDKTSKKSFSRTHSVENFETREAEAKPTPTPLNIFASLRRKKASKSTPPLPKKHLTKPSIPKKPVRFTRKEAKLKTVIPKPATLPDYAKTPQYKNSIYTLIYDFQAQNDAELTAAAGDVVILINDKDLVGNNDWCYVERCAVGGGSGWDSAGERGYLPRNYIQRIEPNQIGK